MADRAATTQPQKTSATSFRYDILIPAALFAVFLALTLPGIAWGAPSTWHPDEVVYIAINMLYGQSDIDAANYNHPHLPIYAMLGLGKIILALGGGDREVLIGARVLSALLVGLTIVLAYVIPRRAGYSPFVAGLSGLLLLSVSEMSHNGRFAHNDTFVTFFSTLAFYFLVEYRVRKRKGWLYAGFFSIGLAVSSKYSAISLVVLPILLYVWDQRKVIRKEILTALETLFVGCILAFLGYAAGTPQALLWMAFYFKRVIPALIYNANYGRQPDTAIGALAQYPVFANGVGLPLFLLFAAALLWVGYRLLRAYRMKTGPDGFLFMLLTAILIIDLPIMTSYNYPIRFFLPLMPLFAILGALFIHDMAKILEARGTILQRRLAAMVLGMAILFSLARSVSVMLLFLNDARIPASAYLATLPAGTSLEHTEYPPSIPAGHFKREYNYPLFFIKAPDQEVPVSRNYIYNEGESGLVSRRTDYLVVDSFTADKIKDPFTCKAMAAECDFFTRLASGGTDHYRLIREFTYTLPSFLPRIKIAFVDPSIRVYERIP